VFTVSPGINASLDSLRGHIWKNFSPQDTTLIIVATCRAGSGKVGGIGDSSPCCDGTGPTSHENNWIEHDNREVFLNICHWLLTSETAVEEPGLPSETFALLSFPYLIKLYSSSEKIFLTDLGGRTFFSVSPFSTSGGRTYYLLPDDLKPSVYFAVSPDMRPLKITIFR
ncbi:hypothetical protein JW890_00365, partial [candidate division WOR-3 bacterium]|nr:hypothetical protein [candidate division WOR-3 bacterium]